MSKEESFELVFTCDSNPVPVTKDVMEDPNTGGQDNNMLVEDVKENLDTGVRDNKTESSAVIGVHGPRLEDLNIWKKPQETKPIDEGLWKRFKDLMKKKRISSSGSLNSFWKLKNVSTNRKDAEKTVINYKWMFVFCFLTVTLIGLGVFLHSGMTSEDVLRHLNETSKCIFHEDRVVCSQELLQELLNKKPLWLEWSNFTEMLTTLTVRVYESLSCITMVSVIPMMSLVLLLLYFVTKQTQSNLEEEDKSLARPASLVSGSMLSHPYIASLLLSVTAVFLLQCFVQHNINVKRLVEQQRLMGGKELMKKDFADWLSQDIMRTGGSIDVEFGNLKEFHRCKSLEDVDAMAFQGIVDNMAKVLEISDDRREEIQMAQHAQSMVNVIEDFEHGPTGFYTYGKYQTLKRTNGNMDIVFALHAFKWKLENTVGMGDKDKVMQTKKVNMRERNVWKHHFRTEAMKLFEADCPQHLVTEMKLRERRNKERQEITDKEEEEVKNWILVMYEKAKLKGEKDHVKKVNKAEVESVWGTIF